MVHRAAIVIWVHAAVTRRRELRHDEYLGLLEDALTARSAYCLVPVGAIVGRRRLDGAGLFRAPRAIRDLAEDGLLAAAAGGFAHSISKIRQVLYFRNARPAGRTVKRGGVGRQPRKRHIR